MRTGREMVSENPSGKDGEDIAAEKARLELALLAAVESSPVRDGGLPTSPPPRAWSDPQQFSDRRSSRTRVNIEMGSGDSWQFHRLAAKDSRGRREWELPKLKWCQS
jgi:hypothetical protein